MTKKSFLGNLLLLLCAVIWGGAFVAQRSGMDSMGPVTFNGIRSLMGAAALLLFLLLRSIVTKKPFRITRDEWKYGLICGGILFVSLTCQQIGLATVSAGRAGFLSAVYIVLVPIIRAVGGKRPSANAVIAVLLTLFGLTLLSAASGAEAGTAINFSSLFTGFSTGDLLMLICAFTYSFHIICIDRVAEKVDSSVLCCLQFAVCGLISLPVFLIFEGTPNLSALSRGWTELAYAGILSSAVAYTLQIAGQKLSSSPTVAAVLMSTESVFAVIFGMILLREKHHPYEYLGCLIVFAGIIIAQLPPLKHKKQKSDSQPG